MLPLQNDANQTIIWLWAQIGPKNGYIWDNIATIFLKKTPISNVANNFQVTWNWKRLEKDMGLQNIGANLNEQNKNDKIDETSFSVG